MFIDSQGNKWQKGNLHMHTTRSDGEKTPEEAVGIYQAQGYDFLAITDHWTYGYAFEQDGVTVLAGDEYSVGAVNQGGLYHIIGIGCAEKPKIKSDTTFDPQTVIDAIHEGDGLAILAHPAWSLNTPASIMALRELDGVEIYNSISTFPRNVECRAYSGLIVDMLASKGRYLPLFAHDDVHFYQDYDRCRSFIYVKSETNGRDDLFAAIRRGDFYPSQGPQLSCAITDGVLHVSCSPVSSISVISDCVYTPVRNAFGENLTEFTYAPNERDHYLRVEICDADGHYAWSQIMPL